MRKNKNIILNGLIDLAQPRLGTKVVYRTDDFFAAAKRIDIAKHWIKNYSNI